MRVVLSVALVGLVVCVGCGKGNQTVNELAKEDVVGKMVG